jgi:two-component system, chemotaxis family, chemotaxis protein CheY
MDCNTKTIMIVDDSSSIRQLISITLRRAEYQVVEAVNGQDALSKIKENKINMVLADIHMPCMNGIELIKNLRADPRFKFIPIIILTTESQVEKKKEGKTAGATGWIIKPFHPEQLLAVVKRVLD